MEVKFNVRMVDEVQPCAMLRAPAIPRVGDFIMGIGHELRVVRVNFIAPVELCSIEVVVADR